MIVGTQTDLRDDPQVREKLAKQRMQPVRKEDGERMAKELGAVKYVECSALTQYKLKDVFDEVSEDGWQNISLMDLLSHTIRSRMLNPHATGHCRRSGTARREASRQEKMHTALIVASFNSNLRCKYLE